MDKKIRTMLIEDHKLLRSGLRSLFEHSDDIIVLAEAETGKEGIEKAKMHKPDVVIVDLGLDDMSGVEVARTIIDNNPEIKIIVLTSHQNANEVVETLRAGVNAYVVKDIADEILIMVIKSVAQGAIWLDPKVVDIARKNSSGVLPVKTYSRASFKAQHANLTEREYEVLKLVVEGKSNQQIAEILSISEHTSKAHVCNIIQKLVVDDRTQAAVKAIKEGIV
jgi:DNA-binding NarL/FixJ family response regulator